MSETAVTTTLPPVTTVKGYLNQALELVRQTGLLPGKPEDSPAVGLLKDIDSLDKTRILIIGHTLQNMETFNRLVRENTAETKLGNRFQDIAQSFGYIREDCELMIQQLADGKIDWKERMQNALRQLRRGTPHSQFEKIRDKFQSVFMDSKKQIEREEVVLKAYETFRLALSEGEIAASELAKQQLGIREQARTNLVEASKQLDAYSGQEETERKRLQLSRDEADRAFVQEDRRYQLLLDLAENLKVGYNVGEAILLKFRQTHGVKTEVYRKATVFFTTCEHVLTSLDATITAQKGLHEGTQTLEALKAGINEGLETVAKTGSTLETAALKSAYGPAVQAESVKKLVDEIVRFQIDSVQLVEDLRAKSAENSAEIQRLTDEGKKRYTESLERYKLGVPQNSPAVPATPTN